jgi:hypothetical protein
MAEPVVEILVPRPGTLADAVIAAGSGVVAVPASEEPGKLRVYYEGNLYNAANIRTWADRVRHAAERLLVDAAVIATGISEVDEFVVVGRFAAMDGVVLDANATARSTLCRWLDISDLDLDSECRLTEALR